MLCSKRSKPNTCSGSRPKREQPAMVGPQGAEAPLSGLLAMLAAAKALGAAQDCSGYRRRLVFAAMAGDMWGAMGTRRLLWELQSGSAATAGLNLADIDQVPSRAKLCQTCAEPEACLRSHSKTTEATSKTSSRKICYCRALVFSSDPYLKMYFFVRKMFHRRSCYTSQPSRQQLLANLWQFSKAHPGSWLTHREHS